jgi:hypothetical protein
MAYYNVPQHRRQLRASKKLKRRVERIKDTYIDERKFESERMLGNIKDEIMMEMGIPLWENEGNLSSRLIGEIGSAVKERYESIRYDN